MSTLLLEKYIHTVISEEINRQVLLENHLYKLINEEILAQQLLEEGKITDWLKRKFSSAYNMFVYDKDVVKACMRWLEKNKGKNKKAEKFYKQLASKEHDKRFRFVAFGMLTIMALLVKVNNLDFGDAFEKAVVEVKQVEEPSLASDNLDDSSQGDSFSSRTSNPPAVTRATKELASLSPKDQALVVHSLERMFGIDGKVYNQDEISKFITSDESLKASTFSNMSDEEFDSYLDGLENFDFNLAESDDYNKIIATLYLATAVGKGDRTRINNIRGLMSASQDVREKIDYISNAADRILSGEAKLAPGVTMDDALSRLELLSQEQIKEIAELAADCDNSIVQSQLDNLINGANDTFDKVLRVN